MSDWKIFTGQGEPHDRIKDLPPAPSWRQFDRFETMTAEAKTEVNADIGQYIQLGSLGTALLPSQRPRVLLIDEFDKSDINLPNDLLNLFEEGEFEIPELARMAKQQETCQVRTFDGNEAQIRSGKVRCTAFPIIVLTNNGERDFPPAFLRRCLRLTMKPPEEQELMKMVEAHLGKDVLEQAQPLVADFVKRRTKGSDRGDLSTDQLLNIVYLVTSKLSPKDEDKRTKFVESISKYLSSSEDS
jgi:MoxR-like ATPase